METCELWLNGVLLWRFSRRAVNLRVVLSAFQEQGWRQHIDNPIPRTHGRDNKRQLHAAINCLNARLGRWLRFHGNGAGTGLWWELVQSPQAEP